jgi:hypothetical protein
MRVNLVWTLATAWFAGCISPGGRGSSVSGGNLPVAAADASSGPSSDTSSGPSSDTSSGPSSDTTAGETAAPPGDTTPSLEATPADPGTPPPADTTVGPEIGPPPTTGPVNPKCLDGQWIEDLADPTADLSKAISNYSPTKLLAFIQAALEARYPFGWELVKSGNAGGGFGGQKCVDAFVQDTSNASAVIQQLSTLVHECGHMHDLNLGNWNDAGYALQGGTTFLCPGGGNQSFTVQTFSRSRITGDPFSELHPPCGGGWGGDCDSYADTYLDGNPDDGNFESGDQGFDMLLEEAVQYVNSITTGYAFHDHYKWGTSERDGILTFLWYVERYLRMARLTYPSVYADLTGESCWREAILSVWGRAWLYLGASEGIPVLGINDAKLEGLVTDPDLLEEIVLVREKHGCD